MEESHTAAADGEFYNEKILETAKHNFKTKIGTEYTTKDVIRVWDCTSRWIENNINRDKGILMKGIGYFTVAQWDIPVGKGYPYTIRKPVFVIDEKLAKDYNLKRKRPYNTGKIHEHYLNLLSVAHDYDLDPDMVRHCLDEVVTAFRKLLYEEKNCELPFPRIGKLQVKNKRVVMRFYRQFLDRQNDYAQDRMAARKKRYQATSYDPNRDLDQYRPEERPHTAGSVISRPASTLSQYRPGTGYERVLPYENSRRPTSRQSVCSLRPISRPSSNLSLRSNRPGSTRGLSDDRLHKPVSRSSSIRSRSLDRPSSRSSVKSNHLSRPQTGGGASSVDLAKSSEKRFDSKTKEAQIPNETARLSSVKSDKAEKETKFQDNCVDQIENNVGHHLCYLCCKRKQRLDTINAPRPDSQNKDNFMKGDNPFGQRLNTDTENKRKMQLKDTSNYNYVTAKKLAEVIKNENKKAQSEKNVKSYILYKRPKSVTENCEQKNALRRTLLGQIEEKKLKNNTNRAACLEDEKRGQEELIKSLHDERMRNIEAKNRSKESYMKVLNEQLREKRRLEEEQKKNMLAMPLSKTILGTNEIRPHSMTEYKKSNHMKTAEYQLSQVAVRNQNDQEQKTADVNNEICWLNRLKDENDQLRGEMLRKRLNKKHILAEDLKKWLDGGGERDNHKNEIPRSHPMTFPLVRTLKRCRQCKKKLGYPVEKISDLPC